MRNFQDKIDELYSQGGGSSWSGSQGGSSWSGGRDFSNMIAKLGTQNSGQIRGAVVQTNYDLYRRRLAEIEAQEEARKAEIDAQRGRGHVSYARQEYPVAQRTTLAKGTSAGVAPDAATRAQRSIMAYDENGRLNAWQSFLNLISDARDFNAAKMASKTEEQRQAEAEERERFLRPKTAEEAKEAYGLNYDLEARNIFGKTVYVPKTGTSMQELHGLDKGASDQELASKLVSDARQQVQNVRNGVQSVRADIEAGGRKTGNPVLDNWGETMRKNADAARMIAQAYGLPTYAIEGSVTQQNADEFLNDYSNRGYLQSVLPTAGLTAADYALSIANAGLTATDALSGGRLGKSNSVYQIANFMQNAGSGLTAQAIGAMRESTNWLGKLALDMEKTSIEQILDRVIGQGAGGLAPMGVRVFGQGAQEAEDRGESLGQQVKTGILRAGVEVGTEQMAGVGGSWRGTGYGEAFFGKLDKWVASKTGSELLGTLVNAFGGEAVEEMIADVLNPLVDRIFGIGEVTGRGEDRTFMQRLGDFLADVWNDGQLLYDGLLGGLSGSVGGGVTHAGYGIGAKNLGVDIATYKAAERIAGNNRLRSEFEKLSGVKLSGSDADAMTQIAFYLTNVTDASNGNVGARQAESNLEAGTTTGVEQAAAKNAAAKRNTKAERTMVANNLRSVFNGSNFDLTDEQAQEMTDLYDPNVNSGYYEYIRGAREAYEMGRNGVRLVQARQASEYAPRLTDEQFNRAWAAGASAQNTVTETADTNTAEGKTRLAAALNALGAHAAEAEAAYEPGQDVNSFAAAMNKAAALYAANGMDLQQIVQDARDGKTADIVGRLTDAQVETAAKIGKALEAEQAQAIRQSAAQFREIRQQAAAAVAQQAKNAQALANVNAALEASKQFGQSEMNAYKEGLAALEAMVKADPSVEGTEAYNEAYDKLLEHRKNVEEMQKAVKELEAKRAELQKQQAGKRKKGTVILEGGEINGMKVNAVDQSKLNRQQKKVVAMVEALADAVNIDYVLYDGDAKGVQGAYTQGGTIYLNINAGMAVGKSLAAATLSHELTHYLQEYAPEEYAALREFLTKEVLNKTPGQLDAMVRRQLRLEPNLDYDGALNEVIANACQRMLLDSKAVRELARQNMTLAEKIADVIDDLSNKIRAAFEEAGSDDVRFRDTVKAVEAELDRVQALWDNALKAASENYNAEQMTGRRAVRSSDSVPETRTASAERTESAEEAPARANTKAENKELNDLQEWMDSLHHDEDTGKLVDWTGFPVTEQELREKKAKLRELTGTQFQSWDNMHPTILNRVISTTLVTASAQELFRNVSEDSENYLSAEEIEEALDYDNIDDRFYDVDTVLQSLSGIAAEKGGRTRTEAFRIMDQLLMHVDSSTAMSWIGENAQDSDFAEWYDKLHPSLYYPGYKRGDLRTPHPGKQGAQTRRNIEKEKTYLRHLLERKTLPAADRAEAERLLEQVSKIQTSRKRITFYQTWSDTEVGEYDMRDFQAAVGKDGKPLFQIYAMEHDEDRYREMLTKWGGMSGADIDELFLAIDVAMDKIKANLEALDYAWDVDIDDRGFNPVKPNSDPLYKISVDFSTLCRKRILQGAVQNQLQAALNRALTREEGIAIRDALVALQEEGKQIEVACALCYVESARMRSPAQIQKFLNDREAVLRDFFAGKDAKGTKQRMRDAELAERQAIYDEQGMIRGKGADNNMYDVRDPKAAPLKRLPGKLAERIRAAKKAAKAGYELTAEQQGIIDAAKGMSVTDFTSPEGLENLAKNHREIFDAYTSFIRNATNSKGIENDTWWRAGDSSKVSDLLIEQMNRENGTRTQSWSDFQVKHLMDYIAATIELATRGAKQHAYTKVIDYVDLMGDTGVMINMSLIPTREYNGTLRYDDVEGFVYKEALRLRDKYHATAGTICIGVDDAQIRQLMASDVIDYIIPYHHSGMAKHTRKAMRIPNWTDYQDFQNEKELKGAEAQKNAERFGVKLLDESDPNWHKHTKFSDWFDLERARAEASAAGRTGEYGVMTGGYAAMQAAAENYKKLCAERGLAPKFSYGRADFSGEQNYWKLLIDRKMVDNVTGEVIEQQAIKPQFDIDTIQRILDDELERYGRVKEDQNEATRRVTEAFLGGKIKGGMKFEDVQKAMQKPVDNISITNITQNAAQMQAWGDAEGVANKRLAPIDKDLRESLLSSGNNTIVDSREKVVQTVADAFANPSKKGVAFFGVLRPDILQEFQNKATNVPKRMEGRLFKNNKGYLLAATYDSIRHLNEELKLSQKEIAALLDRLADIVLDNDTIKYADYIHDKQKIPGLLFEKDFGDGGYGAFNLISGTRRRLGLQTMYIEGRDSTIKGETLPHHAAQTATSETKGAQISPDFIVPDAAAKRNTQSQVWNEEYGEYIPYNHRAIVTEETLDRWMDGEHFGASNPNYAQAYIAYMKPEDFLHLSTIYDMGRIRSETEPLDEEKLKASVEYDPIKLKIDTETGEVLDHEGRHRMMALMREDVTRVPVLLFDFKNKNSKVRIDSLMLRGQEFNGMRNSSMALVTDLIPLNKAHRDIIVQKFSTQESFERSKEKLGIGRQMRFQQWDDSHNEWAPTFYSKMENTVNEWTNGKGQPLPPKMSAQQVVGWLKGKGVKAEEIRWSGIVPWLEGRKTVTKQELQQVMAENRIQIETQVLDDVAEYRYEGRHDAKGVNFGTKEEARAYAEQVLKDQGAPISELRELENSIYLWFERDDTNDIILTVAKKKIRPSTKWGGYTLPGARNYREVLFKMPSLGEYSNDAMAVHWEDTNVMAHARVEDMTGSGGRRVLFVEEIQSDLHNEGAKKGFGSKDHAELQALAKKYHYEYSDMTPEDRARYEVLRSKLIPVEKEYMARREEWKKANREAHKAIEKIIERFRARLDEDEDMDYSWRRILYNDVDMAGIARWVRGESPGPINDRYGYLNDEDGKKMQADALAELRKDITPEDQKLIDAYAEAEARKEELSDTYLQQHQQALKANTPDVPFAGSADTYHEYVMKNLLRMAAEGDYDTIAWTTADLQSERWSDDYAEGYKIEYDQNIPKFMRKYVKQWGATVGSINLEFENGSYEEAGYKKPEVWSVDLTMAMRQSVLHEGQPLFQMWDDTTDDTAAEANGRELAYTRLQSENAILSESVAALKKLTAKKDTTIGKLQDQLRLTKTKEVREADARKLAKQLLKDNSSQADLTEITEQLKALGDYILQTPVNEVSEQEIKDRARGIASEIVDNAVEQVAIEDETMLRIAKDLKGKKLTIDPQFHGELDGGFQEFRKRMMGKLTIASADSTRIDRSEYSSVSQYYADLQGEYGQMYFPDLANEGEELSQIARVFELVQPVEVNPFDRYEAEVTEELANRIAMDALGGIMRVSPPTFADKQKARRVELQEQIKQLKAEQKLDAKEAGRLYQTIYDLSVALDKAESKYRTLRTASDYRLAQARREGSARAIEIKAAERARAAEQISSLKAHYREMQERASERRQNTATRNKIRKLIADLNKRLAHPTESKHVPRELMQMTLDVLNMIDLDTGRGSTKVAEKIADIRAMYDSYRNNPTYQIAYDETVAEMLNDLETAIHGMRLVDMNDRQLTAVYNVLKGLTHVIDTAVKVKIGTEERNAFELAREMTAETRGIPKAQQGWLREHFLPAHLRADVAFRRFAGHKKGSTWEKVARMLNDGQLKQTRVKMELSRPFEKIFSNQQALADFTGVNWRGKIDQSKLVDIGLKDADGNAILLTHDLMVSVYMDLLNEENRKHFIRTGKTIPNLQDYYDGKGGWGAGAVRSAGIAERLSELDHQLNEAKRAGYGDWADQLKAQIDDLMSEGEQHAIEVQQAIEREMTDFDKAWVEASQQLMDVDSKRELNATTMEVYGIEKASVPNYWPITTDPDFLSKPMETVVKDMSLENVGFMKERIGGANPTLALGTVQIVTRQIDRVAQYCGIMPAVRSFGKIWSKTEAGYADSLKKSVRTVFQKSGVDYVENLIADLQGSRSVSADDLGLDALFGKLRGNLAQSTLTLNPRVALAQAASFPTAAAEVGWKNLGKALARGGKGGRIISAADQELIAKWSPLLWYRMQGYSTPELGDIQGSNDPRSRLWRKARWLTGWIQAVDGATVGRLWYAAEYWVQEKKPTLEKGSDAYYEAVAEKFNAVVEKTQPNYTPMQRASILRSPSSLIKTFTMFMTQRLQNMNILYDATASYQKQRADLANGRNGVTQADVEEARHNLLLAASSQLVQTAVFVGIKMATDALLRNLKGYRDKDTGDLTEESVSAKALDMFIDAMAGSFVGGSELYTMLKAMTGHGKWYGLSVSGVDTVNDLVDSLVKLAEADKDLSDPENRQKLLGKLADVGANLAQAFGIPAANAGKIGNALKWYALDAAAGKLGATEAGYERTKKQRQAKAAVDAGIPKKLYKQTMKEANTNGGDVTQTELGTYLRAETEAGRITPQQAETIWSSQEWKTDYEKWTADTEKAEAKQAALEAAVASASLTVEEYEALLESANTDGNNTVTQDELGTYLQAAIKSGKMSKSQATAVWNTKGWKTSLEAWSAKH